MAKEHFKDWNPKAASVARVEECEQIVDSYQAQGYKLTLRQLYYQLVSRNIIPNSDKEYSKLGALLSKARLAGMIDWDAIEDRVRQPWTPQDYEGLEEAVDDMLRYYRLQRWQGQVTYAELWVEKDALAGVLQPLASRYHTTLMVNRGYSSSSAMYESANRFNFMSELLQVDNMWIFYLGDLDPSGEDMVRDIQDRMVMFGMGNVVVKKVALTMAQVRQYNPPPNPAKLTDSRAEAFIARYGTSSWEVDALPPNVLHQIIETDFDAIVDQVAMDAVREQEARDKDDLRNAVRELLDSRF